MLPPGPPKASARIWPSESTRKLSGCRSDPIVILPPWPSPLWTLVVTWLSKRLNVDPVLVTEMLPPSARSDVVVMALPPCMESVLPKTRLMLPASASALPVLLAEIVDPPCSETSPAVMLMSPPTPVPLVLDSRLAPPSSESEPASMAIVPARPAPEADAEICPWLLRLTLDPDTAIWPAFPVPVAVLKRPVPAPETEVLPAVTAMLPPPPAPLVLLSSLAAPARERLPALTSISPAAPVPAVVEKSPAPPARESAPPVASTVTVPPGPAPVVLLLSCAPPSSATVPPLSWMLPAAPAPVVATDIAPPWVIVTIGLETTMEPAAPAPSAVENSPAPPLTDRELDALTAIVPPWPDPVVLLSIRPVSARFTVFAATAI